MDELTSSGDDECCRYLTIQRYEQPGNRENMAEVIEIGESELKRRRRGGQPQLRGVEGSSEDQRIGGAVGERIAGKRGSGALEAGVVIEGTYLRPRDRFAACGQVVFGPPGRRTATAATHSPRY